MAAAPRSRGKRLKPGPEDVKFVSTAAGKAVITKIVGKNKDETDRLRTYVAVLCAQECSIDLKFKLWAEAWKRSGPNGLPGFVTKQFQEGLVDRLSKAYDPKDVTVGHSDRVLDELKACQYALAAAVALKTFDEKKDAKWRTTTVLEAAACAYDIMMRLTPLKEPEFAFHVVGEAKAKVLGGFPEDYAPIPGDKPKKKKPQKAAPKAAVGKQSAGGG